jgi:hypothetical protein
MKSLFKTTSKRDFTENSASSGPADTVTQQQCRLFMELTSFHANHQLTA